MKKTLLALTIVSLATACKKDYISKDHKTETTVYLQIEAPDNDNLTTTVSDIKTVKVKQ